MNVITQARDELRQALSNPDLSLDVAARQLKSFMSHHTVDKSLRVEMVMLAARIRKAGPNGDDAALREDFDRLVRHALREADDSDANDALEARRTARERLRGRQIDDRVVVKANDLGKTYAEFSLSGVDLELRLGQITGVVGENANGKTTLFRLLVGELKQSHGTLCYPELGAPDPNAIKWGQIRNKIAYVPQTLKPWHGALEDNLRFAAASRGILGTENDEEFRYITQRLGLTDYLSRSWHEISGGYKLRFELARALIWRPQLLALDEPLANLDFKAQLTLLRDVQALARSFTAPIAVVISSQHLHEVEAVADKILFLRRGAVVYNGPTENVGDNRVENTFEINAVTSIDALKDALADFPIERVYYNGLSFVIEAGLALSATELMRALITADIKISYFRDLSKSVKQLFEQTTVS